MTSLSICTRQRAERLLEKNATGGREDDKDGGIIKGE